MGFFKKLVGSAAVIGAAVGGVSYLKKRKEEKYTEDDIFEDFDDEKIFDIKTNSNKNGTQKITITFNSNKAKSMANNAADKVLEASDSAKEKIVDVVGEEKYDSAVKKVTDAATFAKDKASDAKDKITDFVGEDRIDNAKDLFNDAVDFAKDKTSEVIDKVKNYNSENDFVDADYSDIDDFESFDDDDFVDESDDLNNDFDENGSENDDFASSVKLEKDDASETFENNDIPSEENHVFEDIDDIKQDDDSFEDTNISSEEGIDIFEEESVPNVNVKEYDTESNITSDKENDAELNITADKEYDTESNITADKEYDTELNITDDELDNKGSISDDTLENQAAREPDEFNELDDELNDDTFDNIKVNNDSLDSNEYDSEKDSDIVEEHFSFLKKPYDKSDDNASKEDPDFLDDELDKL